MAEITAAQVKELREKTGAGMMDCKKALIESGADLEAAVDWLRKKGLAAAAKKAGRTAAEGLVGIASAGTRGAVVEVNSETDFVARNDQFRSFVSAVAEKALDAKGNIDALKASDFGDGDTVEAAVSKLIGTIGENMNLRRTAYLEVSDGVVASYVHNQEVPGLGKIGVLVALESTGDKAKLEAFGRQVAMHIAATNPQSVNIDELDPALLARERDVLSEQARASGKPEEIIGKMVEGRLRKYYEEVVLLEQVFVIDGESRVAKAVEGLSKDLGAAVKITGFVRMQLGEGVEREEKDFASEVAAQLGN
ncbi:MULTISPECIES: translation elongation factor Ts [Limibacillus]|jgi:elongation factor Ts|uniref:Elongation factor Ts n=1 Tax=Limibacillus halophilus TaxID=1579333 RepID=A0A839SWI8_9PROT|nr:translation elongation factor Ts [Limibacillus halophilus]MBB3065876.1 elongation factor Ts [Limibacillus halophilus]